MLAPILPEIYKLDTQLLECDLIGDPSQWLCRLGGFPGWRLGAGVGWLEIHIFLLEPVARCVVTGTSRHCRETTQISCCLRNPIANCLVIHSAAAFLTQTQGSRLIQVTDFHLSSSWPFRCSFSSWTKWQQDIDFNDIQGYRWYQMIQQVMLKEGGTSVPGARVGAADILDSFASKLQWRNLKSTGTP